MKLRLGFVSNSSSSSYVIYGIDLPYSCVFEGEYDEKKIYSSKLKEIIEKKILEEIETNDYIKSRENVVIYVNEIVDEMFEYKDSMDVYGDYTYYLGRPWKLVRDDQTGLEFKQEIKNLIKPYFPNAIFGTYEDLEN